ncbi:MAG: alanine--tRNA ligase [Parcubacteria group bacterium]|nr:alanine--tRNA ligase [Parcubacteria group bacterium]
MQSDEIRKRFLEFFKKRGHAIIPSAPLVPENDPSVLFTTAGMQPLVPYLLGEPHPAGRRIADVQKCVRTTDIEEVGDSTHLTFFEMLGNWSLGDPASPDGIGEASYFKEDAIRWSYEFLTSKDEGLGLDPKRLYITCFAGDADAPKDEESARIWRSLGIPAHRIYFQGKDDNWWSPGDNGPSGPDSEMFYDLTPDGLGDVSFDEFKKADNEQKVVEVWNDVFMEYEKKDGKVIGKLKQKNVDTGAGLERTAAVMQGVSNVFETDLFRPLMDAITARAARADEKSKRVIADHTRAAVFLIADGVAPSNTDRGYILRRLIRRAVRYGEGIGFKTGECAALADVVIEQYGTLYSNIIDRRSLIREEIEREESKFRATLARGMKEFEKRATGDISGLAAFDLYQTYGFPVEMTDELARERGVAVDVAGFREEFRKHQETSRIGAEQKFKGGLAGHGSKELEYHTATHLLHQALRDVLGTHVFQKGSNINPERLRFDFSHTKKMTAEEIAKIERIVNEKIRAGLPVSWSEMTQDEARSRGAIGLFEENYGERVKVYQIGDEKTGVYSREFCGGPHVENTADIKGIFKITKEEAVAAGIRRIKAVVE